MQSHKSKYRINTQHIGLYITILEEFYGAIRSYLLCFRERTILIWSSSQFNVTFRLNFLHISTGNLQSSTIVEEHSTIVEEHNLQLWRIWQIWILYIFVFKFELLNSPKIFLKSAFILMVMIAPLIFSLLQHRMPYQIHHSDFLSGFSGLVRHKTLNATLILYAWSNFHFYLNNSHDCNLAD